MILGSGRYSEILARLLTGSTALDVSPALSPEISPVFVLENDRPEWLFLGNQRAMQAQAVVAAGGANNQWARLRNPAGSNVLCVVEAVKISSPTICVCNLYFGVATTDRGSAGALVPRDSRLGAGITAGACKVSSDNAAVNGVTTESAALLASSPYEFVSLPIVMLPGSHIDVGSETVNVQLRVNIRYREREIGRYESGR